MFPSAKAKHQKLVRQLQCQKQCIDHIPYDLSGLSRALFSDNLSRNSCIDFYLHGGGHDLVQFNSFRLNAFWTLLKQLTEKQREEEVSETWNPVQIEWHPKGNELP